MRSKSEIDSEYYFANRERILARQKAYQAAHQDDVKRRRREYYLKNRESLIKGSSERQKENKENARASTKKWTAKNKDKIRANVLKNIDKYRAYSRNRRAALRAANGKHTKNDVLKILANQKNSCAWCSKKFKDKEYHVDHIVPLVLGGSNGPENIQILCISCNCAKGGKHPIEWAQENGKLL